MSLWSWIKGHVNKNNEIMISAHESENGLASLWHHV